MRVLVTGATGFVGKHVVQKLSEKGHSVVALSRNSEKAKSKLPTCEVFNWNPEKEAAPVKAFEGVEAVIHLAGEGVADRRWSDEQKSKIYNSRIQGTRNLVKTLNTLSKKPTALVSASAIGFYGDRGEENLSENASAGSGFLADVCKDWEKESSQVSPDIRLCIVRIGIVLGKEGGMLKRLLPLFKLGAGGPVGDGKQWMSWIHVEDLAALFVHLAEKPSAKGIFNGVAPQPVTNAGFAKAMGTALHRPAFMPAPAFGIRLAMGELSTLVLASQKVVPSGTESTGFKFKYANTGPALEEIVKKKV